MPMLFPSTKSMKSATRHITTDQWAFWPTFQKKKILYKQLSKYFDSLLAANECGFRKGFSSQYCLLVMLEKYKEAIDRENQFWALLINLLKAFDCIDHKLQIAKPYEYGVSSSALNIISSYLKHRTQWTKINDYFSTRSNIEYSVHKDEFWIH